MCVVSAVGMSSYQARQFLLCGMIQESFWCDGLFCQPIVESKSIAWSNVCACFCYLFLLILFTSERFILYHHMMINPDNGSPIFLCMSLSADGYLFFPVKSWTLRTPTDLSASCNSCNLLTVTQVSIIRHKSWFCGKRPLLLCREWAPAHLHTTFLLLPLLSLLCLYSNQGRDFLLALVFQCN